MASELPQLTVLSEEQLALLQEPTFVEYPIYIELGFHLDLKSLVFPVRIGNYRRVAVISPDADASEWHDWADTIVSGANAKVNLAVPHLWRSVLTGEVLDWASLQTFWYELIHGAYGKVRRAKGIFDVADGRSLSFNFVAGLAESDSIELDLPLWSVGRPDRFSGIELVGEQLDERAISETLQDCCLDDARSPTISNKFKHS